jgi:copper chaperone CopZ
MLSRSLLGSVFALALLAMPARAADVQLKGLHLCCANCVSVLEGALGEVTGVSKVTVDRGAASADFKTTGPDVTTKALAAIGKAGMYASVTVDGKPAPFPQEAVKPGTTAERIVFEQVHLCCRACTNGVVRALEKDDTLGIIECNQKDYTVLISAKGGSTLDLAKIQAALNKAGYHAKVKSEAAKEPKK